MFLRYVGLYRGLYEDVYYSVVYDDGELEVI